MPPDSTCNLRLHTLVAYDHIHYQVKVSCLRIMLQISTLVPSVLGLTNYKIFLYSMLMIEVSREGRTDQSVRACSEKFSPHLLVCWRWSKFFVQSLSWDLDRHVRSRYFIPNYWTDSFSFIWENSFSRVTDVDTLKLRGKDWRVCSTIITTHVLSLYWNNQ